MTIISTYQAITQSDELAELNQNLRTCNAVQRTAKDLIMYEVREFETTGDSTRIKNTISLAIESFNEFNDGYELYSIKASPVDTSNELSMFFHKLNNDLKKLNSWELEQRMAVKLVFKKL